MHNKHSGAPSTLWSMLGVREADGLHLSDDSRIDDSRHGGLVEVVPERQPLQGGRPHKLDDGLLNIAPEQQPRPSRGD